MPSVSAALVVRATRFLLDKMADTSSTFIQRVISALLGAIVVFSLGYFGGTPGMQLTCLLAIVLGIREFSRIAFQQIPFSVSLAYWAVGSLLIAALYQHFELAALEFAIANLAFFSLTIWLTRSRVSNDLLMPALAMGSFGLIYCLLFPFFAFKLVSLDDGGHWFLFLLLVVFFGDTFAYFCGRWFGRRKLMPQVSPNKTWEGSVGGLLGSCLAGLVYGSSVFQDVPVNLILVFCVICGLVAQSGDLLISLVKRVGHVKDSGHIMPGHGGILDRLDGVFIACPLVYAFALYVRPF